MPPLCTLYTKLTTSGNGLVLRTTRLLRSFLRRPALLARSSSSKPKTVTLRLPSLVALPMLRLHPTWLLLPMQPRITHSTPGPILISRATSTLTVFQTTRVLLATNSEPWHAATLTTSATVHPALQQLFLPESRAASSGFLTSSRSVRPVDVKRLNTRLRGPPMLSGKALLLLPTVSVRPLNALPTRLGRSCR